MTFEQIIKKLESYANAKNVAGMARFGISGQKVIGGPGVPVLRKMSQTLKHALTPVQRHKLALRLWRSGIHEARSLATLIDDPKLVTEQQMEQWAGQFENWADCDAACGRLFDRTPWAFTKINQWANRPEEFVRRAGFVMLACLAVHDKRAPDSQFVKYFPLIKKYSIDQRNFVSKAVNWALRQIGKRNLKLNRHAIALATELSRSASVHSHWVGMDALREFNNPKIISRLT